MRCGEHESLGSINYKLSAAYSDRVLFIDRDQTQTLHTLKKEDSNAPRLLIVKGPYAILVDKIAAAILAAGKDSQVIGFKGLTREGNIFIYYPVVPIDYERQFKRYYEALKNIEQAA